MKQILSANTTLETAEDALALHYRLFSEQDGGITHYGIEASQPGERVSVHRLTASEAFAAACYRRIVAGGVTPMCLKEVLEDLVAEE